MTYLDTISSIFAGRTPGRWGWMGHLYDREIGKYRWSDEPSAVEGELQLAVAEFGDIHPISGGTSPVIISAMSCGYGGEVDIGIQPKDALFISFTGSIADELLAVVRAAERFVPAEGTIQLEGREVALIEALNALKMAVEKNA